MSNTVYSDLENKFPAEIDNFDRFQDPNLSQLAAIQQYKNYYAQNRPDLAAAVLNANPDLKRCIFNAENLNQIRDAIISMQRYYMDDVQQYLINIIKWKGEWNGSTKYIKYDVVSYTHANVEEAFMAIASDIPLGTSPTDTQYWIPLTLRGPQGATVGLMGRGNWHSTERYYRDNWVAHNGTIWAAKNDNIGSEPHDNSADWYAVIRDQQHYVISEKEPTTQYTGDIWYKVLNDGTIQPSYKQENGSYAEMNFSLTREISVMNDAINQLKLEMKANMDNILAQAKAYTDEAISTYLVKYLNKEY